MAALPPNWEWDYDGTRWFYRYKPNGHVQFHFPKDGDEFPDFFDAFSPIPDLAPEEKLESQQQLKRRTGVDTDPKSKMHATGGPLSDFAVNRSGFSGPMNDEDDGLFYQPENFMYLGPGAYTDISPLAEEEERDEIARSKSKSKGKGGQDEGKQKTTLEATGSDKTGVSPLQSETATPSVVNSLPVREQAAVPQPVAEDAVFIIDTHELPAPSQPMIPSAGTPLLDSVEKSRPEQVGPVQSGSWDPVGLVAEMATEHTAVAHIERHPDPVEIGDNAVLAPIETRMADLGIAELPERTSPSDAKPPVQSKHELLHQTNMTDHALYGATFGSGPRPQCSSPTTSVLPAPDVRPVTTPAKLPSDHSLPEVVPQFASSSRASSGSPFSIKRKPSKTRTKQGEYQPYMPGSVSTMASEKQNRDLDFKTREHRNSLVREASLMLGTRQSYETSDVPSILQPPKVPPKHPFDSKQFSVQHPVNPAWLDTARTQTEPASVILVGARPSGCHAPAPLQHVPSVLKPARGYPQGKSQEPFQSTDSSPQVQAPVLPGYSNQAASTAASFMAVQKPFPSSYAHQSPDRDTPHSDHIPRSLIPAPCQYQSPYPRPGVQRLATAPASWPLDSHPPGPGVILKEGDLIRSQQTALPAFLQRPLGQSNLDQNHVGRRYAQATPTTIRARSSSDAPQHCHGSPGQSPFPVQTQPPLRPDTAFKPIPESPHMSNIAARPQSAMDFMRGYSQPKMDKNVQQLDPILLSKRPRQTLYADSEVSSLGPPSEGQSLGQPLQTPSPLEAGGWRPSSGFFHGANTNGYPEGSGASIAAQRPNTFNDQNARILSPGSRPGSFSEPSQTSTQPTTPGSAGLDVDQNPPVVPGKIPIHAPVDTKQAIAEAPASPTNRQRSLSTDQTIAGQPILGYFPTYKNGVSNLNFQSPGRPHERGPEILRPHSAQPLPSRLILSLAPGSQPPYPGQEPMRQSTERPPRPTVSPPTQQFIGPSSPRTPGNILHPIQEHGDNDYPVRPSVTNVHQGTQNFQRHSPANDQQLSTGASHYPSSAESSNKQGISKSTSKGFTLAEQPQTISPAVPTAGQMHSPVQKNPFPQSPTNPASYATQTGARPGSTPTVLPSPKDSEKGGWLSKFRKGSGKPNVLQKPQPSQQPLSIASSSPNVMSPARRGHWPNSLPPRPANSGLSLQQHAIQFIPTQESPAVVQKICAPILETASRPQEMAYQDLPRPAADHQKFQPKSQEPAVALGSKEVLKFQGQQQAFPMQRPEQNPFTTSPPKFSLVLVPSSEQFIDNMSDAASVSAISVSTMDVPEAQAQPVLKPQLVTVEKSTSPSGEDQLPSRLAMTRNIDPRTSSTKADQKTREPSPTKDTELTVAPLFSKTPTKATTNSMATDKAPIANNKWAKKPAVDYSGDDWGGDTWDYQ